MTAPDQLTTVPVPRPGLRRLDVETDVILFDRSRGLSHLLNNSAALVWSRLDGVAQVDDVITDLVTLTGSDRATIEPDVLRLVTEFDAIGLTDQLVPEPPTGSVRRTRWTSIRGDVLDRWPAWVPHTPRRAGATTVEVRSDNPQIAQILDEILSCLPRVHGEGATEKPAHAISIVDRRDRTGRGASGDHAPQQDLRLYVDGEVLGRATTIEDATEIVLTRVNLLAIDNTPDRILLHAGAVERDGRAIVVAGVSGRGKSTLTAALVQAGCGYLTDEMVAIDPRTRRVEPFTKAIDLSVGSLDLLGIERPDSTTRRKRPIDPSALGTTSSGGDLAGIVLLVDEGGDANGRAPEAGDAATLIPLDPAPAVIEVLRNTFDPTMDVTDALEVIGQICTNVPIVTLGRTDLHHAVDLVTALLEADRPLPR